LTARQQDVLHRAGEAWVLILVSLDSLERVSAAGRLRLQLGGTW
jgi:hypothetical protein